MILRARLIEIHHAIALLLKDKAESDAVLNVMLTGHTALYMDAEVAARSEEIARQVADGTVRATHDPVS